MYLLDSQTLNFYSSLVVIFLFVLLQPLIRYNYLTGYNNFERVFHYFKLNDEEEFIHFTRMNVQAFMALYDLVEYRLVKTSNRPALPPELRLSLTLQ